MGVEEEKIFKNLIKSVDIFLIVCYTLYRVKEEPNSINIERVIIMLSLKIKQITYRFGDIIITCEDLDDGGRVIGEQLLLMNNDDLKFFKEMYYFDSIYSLIGKYFKGERGTVRGEGVVSISVIDDTYSDNVNIVLLDGGYTKIHSVVSGDPAKLSQDDINNIIVRC